MRIALPAAIDPAAFAGLDPAAQVIDLSGETMGTRWSVRCVPPPGISDDAIQVAVAERLGRLVAEMSHWEPESCLSRFNRSVGGSWTPLPADFAHVMRQGLAIAAATDGAFDPAIGSLVDLWGFGPVPIERPPTATAIDAARAHAGWRRLAMVEDRLRQPGGLALDLSGIAKGHAVDAVADRLAAMGVVRVLMEIGGEFVGRGIRPNGQPWWVDLETPPGTAVPPLRVALHGLAVATSGNYVRGAHTLDPRTGRPIASGVVSVSVIHATALAADAWATALTVLGADRGSAVAREAGIAARIITMADSGAHEHVTPQLAAMLTD